MFDKILMVAGFSVAVALAAPAHATTNLVVNGDFSSPGAGDAGWTNTVDVPGWTNVSEQFLEIGNSGTYGLPCISNGCQSAEVNNNNFDTITQTITGLTVGSKYNFTWYYGGRTGGGLQILDVSVGGGPITVDTGSYGKWTRNWTEFTATSTSETLTFASVDTSAEGGLSSYGNELTNVSVSAVPELSTWAMMLAGFAGLGLAGHRKRKAGDRLLANI